MRFPFPRLCWLLLALAGWCGSILAEEPPLTTVKAIRSLSREAAASGVPVQLRGQITFTYPNKDGGTVIENGGEGIYVDAQSARASGLLPGSVSWPESLKRGAVVEMQGITGPGHFAPVIFPSDIRVVGAEPLPEPELVTLPRLLDGRWDCQRVRLRGVVQFAEEHPQEFDRVRLDLAALGGRIPVNCLERIPSLQRLMDAEVEVTGMIFTYFNIRGEFVGAWMQLANAADVRVLQPGPEDPFAVPELSLSTLRPFSREGATFHRRRSSGTVTLVRPGQFFYMQEGGRGVRVETRDATPLVPGDRVEASGFVEVAEQFGKLRGAVVRKLGVAPLPVPMPVERRRVLGHKTPRTVSDAEDTDGLLASLQGRLEKVDVSDNEGPRLLVESEGYLVSAILGRDTPEEALAHFVPGSEVRLDGIIHVELSSGWPAQDFLRPVNFQLLLQAPENVTTMHPAPWWTLRRVWLLLGGIGAALAVTLGWNWLLRRRVELRSAQLADEMRARREAAVDFDATLRERERLAADLHDTLEQALTGVAFRLEAMVVRRAKAQDDSGDLDRVRQLLASTREDVRRSVWNLRANALDGRSLPEAIQVMADRLAGAHDLIVAVETEGTVRPLPDFIAGNLLLLAVEAMTNALKHAASRSILVRVTFAQDTVTVTVEDEGQGFDLEQAVGPKEGHFGMQGMRERVKRLGGNLEITTAPGKGTRLVVTVRA